MSFVGTVLPDGAVGSAPVVDVLSKSSAGDGHGGNQCGNLVEFGHADPHELDAACNCERPIRATTQSGARPLSQTGITLGQVTKTLCHIVPITQAKATG